jgi:hypothetical protein
MDAAWGVGGKAAARAATTKFGFLPGTITSVLVEAGVGIVGAMLLRRVSPSAPRAFLQGAFMAPIETFAITSQVPILSTYLGGYGTMTLPLNYNAGGVNPGLNTGSFAGYPPRVQLGGYPHGAQLDGFRDDCMGDWDSVAGSYAR